MVLNSYLHNNARDERLGEGEGEVMKLSVTSQAATDGDCLSIFIAERHSKC